MTLGLKTKKKHNCPTGACRSLRGWKRSFAISVEQPLICSGVNTGLSGRRKATSIVFITHSVLQTSVAVSLHCFIHIATLIVFFFFSGGVSSPWPPQQMDLFSLRATYLSNIVKIVWNAHHPPPPRLTDQREKNSTGRDAGRLSLLHTIAAWMDHFKGGACEWATDWNTISKLMLVSSVGAFDNIGEKEPFPARSRKHCLLSSAAACIVVLYACCSASVLLFITI